MRFLRAAILVAACSPEPVAAEPCPRAATVAAGEVAQCDGILWPAGYTAEALRCDHELSLTRLELAATKAAWKVERQKTDEAIGLGIHPAVWVTTGAAVAAVVVYFFIPRPKE